MGLLQDLVAGIPGASVSSVETLSDGRRRDERQVNGQLVGEIENKPV
jgi:hypothetical protein